MITCVVISKKGGNAKEALESVKEYPAEVLEIPEGFDATHALSGFLKKTNTPYLAVLDENTIYFKDKIAEAIEEFSSDKNLGFVYSDFYIQQRPKPQEYQIELSGNVHMFHRGIQIPYYTNVYNVEKLKKVDFQGNLQQTIVNLSKVSIFKSIPKPQYLIKNAQK